MKERGHLRGLLKYTDDEGTLEKYKMACNTARQLINAAPANYIKEGLTENEDSPKKYWTKLKHLMPGKKDLAKSITNLNILDGQGLNLSSPTDMATYVNFFINVGTSLASKIRLDNEKYTKSLPLYIENDNSLEDFSPITEAELQKLCKSINTNKASNIKGVEIGFLKDCMLCTIPQLTFLYNLIFTTNIFPLLWKQATVVPIFKAGLKT